MVSLQNDMVALLFQLSLFRTFRKILNDESTKASAFKEMKTFALFVIRQFFAAAEKVNFFPHTLYSEQLGHSITLPSSTVKKSLSNFN